MVISVLVCMYECMNINKISKIVNIEERLYTYYYFVEYRNCEGWERTSNQFNLSRGQNIEGSEYLFTRNTHFVAKILSIS